MRVQKEPSAKIFKKIEVLELLDSYRKCVQWFFAYPTTEMSLNDLSKVLSMSKTTTRKIVMQLAKERFLKMGELGKVWRISCNQEHFYNRTLKISSNLEKVYLSGIIQEVYKTVPGARAIILFGSYRKGDDSEKSDIDIAVEVLDNQDLRIVELGIVPEFGYRKDIPVNLHIFSRNKIDLNLFANISNGIVLEGFLEVRP